jgi:uncharacterized protein
VLPAAAGIGLKAMHFEDLLHAPRAVGFVEVHAENYMVDGGPVHHGLTRVRECCALSLHGVGLSLGGAGPPDEAHLDRLAALVARYRPAAFSEHLAWSSHAGVFFNDLLPLAYDAQALRRVCAHVDRVQERLQMRLLLENPSSYVEWRTSTMDEAQFLSEVVARTGCGLLLDVTNVHVSCTNRGGDPSAWLAALPLHAVGEIHLAGFARDSDAAGAPLLIDHHGGAVDAAVWALYEEVLAQTGPVATLIEWDNAVPSFARLAAEAGRARRRLDHATQRRIPA